MTNEAFIIDFIFNGIAAGHTMTVSGDKDGQVHIEESDGRSYHFYSRELKEKTNKGD